MKTWGLEAHNEAKLQWVRIFEKIGEVNANVVQRMMTKILPTLRTIEDHRPLSVL